VRCEPSGCEATFPPGWEARAKGLRDGQVFLAHKGSDAYLQLRVERDFEPGAGESFWNPLEMHANSQMSEEMRVLKKLKVASVTSGKWRDSETIERVAVWEGPAGEKIKGRRTWFVSGGRIWCLVFHAPEAAYPAAAAEAGTVRDSLKLPAGAGASR